MNYNYWKEIDKGGLMFDFEDFYTHIAHNLPDNCTLAEIGVANGKSLLFMAAQLAKLNKNFTIHAIDNMDYGSDFQEQTLKEHIAASGFADQVKLHRSDSLAASRLFADGCFDFVFIDAMHTGFGLYARWRFKALTFNLAPITIEAQMFNLLLHRHWRKTRVMPSLR